MEANPPIFTRGDLRQTDRPGTDPVKTLTKNVTNVTHLIDVFQLVDYLVYHRVRLLHFDFRVDTLSFDSVADHTECVTVKKEEVLNIS